MEKKVILHKKKAGAALGGHPWVYDWMIGQVDDTIVDGSAVSLFSSDDDRFVAHGLWSAKGEVRIRLFSWVKDEALDAAFFQSRIQRAISLRKNELGLLPETSCRIVHGDAEGLPGIIADKYGDYLVIQMNASALLIHKEEIIAIFAKELSCKGIQLRVPPLFVENAPNITTEFGEIPKEPIVVTEYGTKFYVDLHSKQKTGFYLDQRENRREVSRFVKDKTVLDLYSYTGGFGISCAMHGAKQVTCVDSSIPAVELGKKNIELNGLRNIEFVTQDCMKFLESAKKESYDVVVLDPPKFATGKQGQKKAMSMYHHANQSALKALKKGGVLVSCSCSGSVSTADWLATLASSARRIGRFLRLIELRGAGSDHPVSLHCPETQYLKCGIFIAE